MTDTSNFKMKPLISRDIRLRKAAQEVHNRAEDIVGQLRVPNRSALYAEEILYDVTRVQALNHELTFLLESIEKELRKELGQEVDEV